MSVEYVEKIKLLLKFGFNLRAPDAPRVLFFDVTNNCNMSCRHCDINRWTTEPDLTIDEISSVARNISHLDELAIGGGEPFLRADLPEICQAFAADAGVSSIYIHTNGYQTENIATMVTSILKKCRGVKVGIGISVDGFQPTHDSIRKAKSYENLLRTADKLQELSKQYPALRLYFSATINSQNYKELPSLARYVSSRFNSTLGYSVIDGTQQDKTLKAPDLYQLEETLDGIYRYRKQSLLYKVYLKAFREVRLKTSTMKRQIIPCKAGVVSCQLTSNGEVYICGKYESLGNIREIPFSKLWKNERAEEQRAAIHRGQCCCDNVNILSPNLRNSPYLPFLMFKAALKAFVRCARPRFKLADGPAE